MDRVRQRAKGSKTTYQNADAQGVSISVFLCVSLSPPLSLCPPSICRSPSFPLSVYQKVLLSVALCLYIYPLFPIDWGSSLEPSVPLRCQAQSRSHASRSPCEVHTRAPASRGKKTKCIQGWRTQSLGILSKAPKSCQVSSPEYCPLKHARVTKYDRLIWETCRSETCQRHYGRYAHPKQTRRRQEQRQAQSELHRVLHHQTLALEEPLTADNLVLVHLAQQLLCHISKKSEAFKTKRSALPDSQHHPQK